MLDSNHDFNAAYTYYLMEKKRNLIDIFNPIIFENVKYIFNIYLWPVSLFAVDPSCQFLVTGCSCEFVFVFDLAVIGSFEVTDRLTPISNQTFLHTI